MSAWSETQVIGFLMRGLMYMYVCTNESIYNVVNVAIQHAKVFNHTPSKQGLTVRQSKMYLKKMTMFT